MLPPADPETNNPYITGTTTPCAIVVVELEDKTVLGYANADSAGNYKVILSNLPLSMDFEINITSFPRDCTSFTILPQATSVNSIGAGGVVPNIYPFGHFWINATIVGGSKFYSTKSTDIFVIDTKKGHRIVYSGFRDNPFTDYTSFGPNIFYIDGEDMYKSSYILNRVLTVLGDEVVVDYTWHANSKSIKLRDTSTKIYKYAASSGWKLSNFI